MIINFYSIKKTGFTLLLFLFVFSSYSYSQGRNGVFKESKLAGSIFITGIGPAYCFGDIGGSFSNQMLFGANDWDVRYTRWLYSIGYRQEFKNRFGIKVTYYSGKFAGSDMNSRLEYRHFSYSNRINELALQGEYTFFGGSFSNLPHSLYVYAGLGVINSDAGFEGDKASRPNDTFKDNVTAPVMPLGIGYQYRITENITLGAEFGWHYAFSDYIDGYSSTTSKRDDTLSALTLTFAYRLFGGGSGKCHCEDYY